MIIEFFFLSLQRVNGLTFWRLEFFSEISRTDALLIDILVSPSGNALSASDRSSLLPCLVLGERQRVGAIRMGSCLFGPSETCWTVEAWVLIGSEENLGWIVYFCTEGGGGGAVMEWTAHLWRNSVCISSCEAKISNMVIGVRNSLYEKITFLLFFFLRKSWKVWCVVDCC